jgi:hypothetical protein
MAGGIPPPPPGIPLGQPPPMIMGPPLPGQYGMPQFPNQGPNQAKPGVPGAGGAAKPPPPGAPRLLDIATTKEVTEVYELHNLRKGKAAGSEKASWKTPQHSTVRAHADVVISKFKLYEKSQNWLNDYDNLRHDILRSMVDTVISERNFKEESKLHEWIIVAVKGTTGYMRASNPFGKPKLETKQVQLVLRRQLKPNQAAGKLGAPGAPGLAGAQQKGAPGQLPGGQHIGGQHPGPGQFNGPPPGYPPQHPQPLPPPMPPNPQMVHQALGLQAGPPRNNGNGMRGPPAGFAQNYNPRVAKYVEDLDSDHDDVATIEHLEYKRRGNKDSKPALRLSGALPPVSRRDRDHRDERRRDSERGHLRSSHRHSRYSKHHTHEGGYRSEDEVDLEYDRRSDLAFGSEASADASSLDSADDLRRRGGGRLRHTYAGDLQRSARESDLLPRRSSHRHRDGVGHLRSLRRARSAERMLEQRDAIADLTYGPIRRAEAAAATAANAAANAAAAAAAAGARPHYAPAPLRLEGPPLPAYYPDVDRRYVDDYPPVPAHPPTPPLGYRPRGLPPMAPLAPPAGDYYGAGPRRRSFYGEHDARYDRAYERAHHAAAAGGPLPPPPFAPGARAGGHYPPDRARRPSRGAAHAGYPPSEDPSDVSRSPSYDSRSDEGGAPALRDLERRTERLQSKIEGLRNDFEWDGGPAVRGVRYGRRRGE